MVHISLLAETARYCIVQSVYVPISHSSWSEVVTVATDLFNPTYYIELVGDRGAYYTL